MIRENEKKCYAPVSPKGDIWHGWIRPNKRQVIRELNEYFAGWRKEGYRVVKLKLTEDSTDE